MTNKESSLSGAPSAGGSPVGGPDAAFVLLDDCGATEDDPRSRLYTRYVRTLSCEPSPHGGLEALAARLDDALREGLHAVAVLSYEDGAALHGIPTWKVPGQMPSRVLLFETVRHLSAREADAWLDGMLPRSGETDGSGAASGIADIGSDIPDREFLESVASIRRYIEAGDTYQVNYTYRLRFAAYGDPIALYRRLRQRQPVPYGALIRFEDGGAVLSLSPELFVRHRQGRLTAQPMKGTAASSTNLAENARQASNLAGDVKNRAENLMIVDLLRNDLGRIAVSGSVTVPALFDVARYGRVLQMTSTVEAGLRHGTSLGDVLAALFPCGSITGAPKRRTMQIIRELEASPRGWYTGAIGWFDPPEPRPEGGLERGIGDFCLSVPIRTLVLGPPDSRPERSGVMGVGSGIVYDSVAQDELAECRLKTRFLTELPPEFSLFETMRVDGEAGCRYLDRHLARLRASAASLGFPWSEEAARQAIDRALGGRIPSRGAVWRLRLQLDPCGSFQAQIAPLAPVDAPVRILLAPQRMASTDLLLRHKTSRRAVYDAAWKAAEAQGAFDMLFRNERNDVTEGGRCNLFACVGGRWVTPPVEAGVLPGVMRSVLLDDPSWNAVESPLSLHDVLHAERLIVCNALRGVLPAELAPDDLIPPAD